VPKGINQLGTFPYGNPVGQRVINECKCLFLFFLDSCLGGRCLTVSKENPLFDILVWYFFILNILDCLKVSEFDDFPSCLDT
jgi:hypothetical protein